VGSGDGGVSPKNRLTIRLTNAQMLRTQLDPAYMDRVLRRVAARARRAGRPVTLRFGGLGMVAAPDGAITLRYDLRRRATAARRNPTSDRTDADFVGSDGVDRRLRVDLIQYHRPTGRLAWQLDRWETDDRAGWWAFESAGSAVVAPGAAPRIAIERPRRVAALVPPDESVRHLARAVGIAFFVALDAAAVELGVLPAT